MKRKRRNQLKSVRAARNARRRNAAALTQAGSRLGLAAIVAGSFSIAQVPVYAAGLPAPCPGAGTVCSGQKFDKLGTNSTLNYGANSLTINQNAASSIFNWSSFNISQGNTVRFIQPSASSVALNRIYDPNLTTIDGLLKANGQVYLINPNGILFGQHAVVDVGGLIASALNVADSRVTSGLLSNSNVAVPVFTNNPAIVGANLAASPGANPAVVVQAGATLYAAGRDQTGTIVSAGRIFLFAPTVENGGSIKVDGGGQVILASGSNIYLGSSTDPSLRGLLVAVNGAQSGVTIDPTGNIQVARGNITLMGMAVNQAGTLTATSALDENGSIRLIARTVDPTSPNLPSDASVLLPVATTGQVTLASGSHTVVALDPTDTATLPLNDPTAAALHSTIDIEGALVNIGGAGAAGSTVVQAHGGDITVTARRAASSVNVTGVGPVAYGVGDGSLLGTNNAAGVINIGSDALIDVSGLQHVVVDGAREFVFIDRLTSNNLANAPLQRTGFLLGQSVYVNLANAPSWLDVSNLQAAVAGTQAERDATAGTIALRAEGSVNLAKGSVLNVSGGSIDLTAAVGRTSQLISATGAVVDISNASADVQYIGFADHGSNPLVDPREGVNTNLTWQVAHYSQVGGYTEGTNAGTIEIYAPAAVLNGTLLGQTTVAPQQRSAPPLGGQLKIGSDNAANLDTEAGISRGNILLGDAADLARGLTPDLAAATGAGLIGVDVDMLRQGGIDRLDLTSDGVIELAPGRTLDLGAHGQLIARGNAIAIDSSVHAAGGAVALSERGLTQLANLSTDPGAEMAWRDHLSTIAATSSLRGSVLFASGTSVSVAGLWTNDLLGGPAVTPSAPIVLNGGVVSMSGRLVDVRGASFDVSAGATLSQKDVFSGGAAGSLSLTGTYRPLVTDTGQLELGSDFAARISGFGVDHGGTLSLAAPSLTLGAGGGGTPAVGASAPVEVDPAVGQRGFQSFNFAGYDSVSVADNASFAPLVKTLQNSSLLTLAPSSAGVVSVSAPLAPLPGQLFGANVSLSASNTADGLVSVGHGAVLDAGATGAISLVGGKQVLVDGTLRAPGGHIGLGLGTRPADQTLSVGELDTRFVQLGADSVLDVSGFSNAQVDVRGLTVGNVLDAGSVALDAPLGTVAVDPGSTILARGAAATVDILRQGAQYQPQLIASRGGTVEVSATGGIFLEGSIDGRGGSAGVGGGSLSVALQAAGTGYTSPILVPDSVAAQLSLPTNLSFTSTLPGLINRQPSFTTPGQGAVAPSLVNDSGFDQVWIQSADAISFAQSTNLSTRVSLVLASQSIAAAPGTTVSINAPYVALGTVNQLSAATTNSSVNPVPQATTGTAFLHVQAGDIDLAGKFALNGIDQATFDASGNVRAIGLPSQLGLRESGSLDFAGNLSINAAQLYPTTQTDFSFQYQAPTVGATGNPSTGQLSIAAPAQSNPLAPLSAGGSISFNVADFVSSGRVLAPLGSIQVNASDAITLLPGSVLSVTGSGLVPYGSVSNGTNWTYASIVEPLNAAPPSIASSTGGAQVPAKSISLTAPVLDSQPGSSLSLAGGGDVLGTGFVAGPGGSYDMSLNFPYTNATTTRNPFFALVPSRGTAVAAYDQQIYADLALNPALPAATNAAFQMGQTITIASGSSIPAGTYTVLPPRYALLPGAFAVEGASGFQDMMPGTSVAMPDGTAIVAGRLGFAGAGTTNARWSGYRVYSDAQFRTLSEFHDYLGSQFFAAADAAAGVAPPRLGPDSASLQIDATSSIRLAGAIDAAPQGSGRGADIGIDAPSIIVSDSAAPPSAPTSTLQLAASTLTGLQAETLVLGAVETRVDVGNGSALALSNPGQSVVVQATAPLSAGEVVLVGSSVTVAAGSTVSASTAQAPTTVALSIGSAAQPTDGALLYAGNTAQPPAFTRFAASAPGTARTGVLSVGAAATISAQSVVFDGTNAQSFAPDFKLATSDVDISAALVNLGNVPAGTSGLDLTPALLTQLGASGNLTITSIGGFNVYGSASVGSATSSGAPSLDRLTFVGPGFAGFGDASGQFAVNAGHVTLDNSAGRSIANAGTGLGQMALNTSAAGSGDGSIEVAGTVGISGFQSVGLSATGRTQSLSGAAATTAAGTGDVTFDGVANASAGLSIAGTGATLTIDATRITAQRGVNASISVPGALVIGATGPVSAPQTSEVGASLQIQAQNVDLAGRIDLPAGVVQINTTGAASTDSITLESGSSIRVAGVTQTFASTTADLSAGSITLSSGSGSVIQSPGATLDLQGAGTQGDAGTLNVVATQGSVNLVGQVLTAPGTLARGADIAIDAAQLSASTLAQTISAGNGAAAADAISIRARDSNVKLASNVDVRAHNIMLEADGGGVATEGFISVAGTLDASGPDGGVISLYANSQTLLQSSAVLDAHATSASGVGGQVMISSRVTANPAAPTSLDAIVLQPGSRVDVSSGGAGASGGQITLRANANSATSPTDVEIAPLPTGSLIGARQNIVEGVIVQSVTGDATLDAAVWQTNASNLLSTYMSTGNRSAMTQRLGESTDAAFSLRPGLEVQATGNILVSDPIEFATGLNDPIGGGGTFTWRYSGGTVATASGGTLATTDPGALTLRAGGNLIIQEAITDGFGVTSPGNLPNDTVWASGESWRYTLTAGADLTASNPNRTGTGAFDLTVQTSPSCPICNNDGPSFVRTGTGSIALNASRDVILNNGASSDLQGNVVYTAGVANVSGLPRFPSLPTRELIPGGFIITVNLTPTMAQEGGDLTISAGRDVLGTDAAGQNQSGSSQTINEWLLRGGLGTAAAPTTWWTDFASFQQGFGALGGGNLAIDAGRNVVRVGAAVPGSGYDAGTGIVQFDHGALSVNAGGTIQQGLFYDQNGTLDLRATTLTSVSSSITANQYVRLAQGDNLVNVQARESAVLDSPFNPTAVTPSVTNYNTSTSPITPAAYRTMFFTYGADSQLDVRVAAGPLNLASSPFEAATLATTAAVGATGNFSVAPPSVELVSFGGAVSGPGVGQGIALFPSATGQASILADSSVSNLLLNMSQIDPNSAVLPRIAAPFDSALGVALLGPSTSSTPLHAADPNPAEVVARTGSISAVDLSLPKTSEIVAAQNIGPLVTLNIQNSNADSLSRISAGNQISYEPDSLRNHIFIEGPGAALIESGGAMNLGTDGSGIDSRGNLDNPSLPPVGASLIVVAGGGRGASGFASQPDFTGLIDNFVRYDAFASSGSKSAALNAQVLAAVSKDASLAPLVTALQAGLSDRASVTDPNSVFSRDVAQLTPAVLATGAVKLAAAVQVVANQQFVGSKNQDTFAPAYAVFGDLFPALNNNAAAIRYFVLNNPFQNAGAGADSLRINALQGLPPSLAAAIELGLASPASVNQPDSAFSKALSAVDSATLVSGSRELLANVLQVAGTSLDALSANGRLTGPGSPYAKELTALADAFAPATTRGLNDLQMDFNQIKTEQTGSVSILAPQGSVIVGQSSAPALDPIASRKSAAQLGIFTYGGGDVIGMARDDFDVFRSRVFTVAGGDIDLWSSQGNIDAGRGARDVTVASPPTLVTDPATGIQSLDFSASVSGSGIGALKTQANQGVSNINLMAPAGYVDAGEAGIRAESGSVTLGTNLVLNAGNIQAASGISGGAVVASPAPPLPPASNNTAGDRAVEEAQREALGQQQAAEERAANQRRMRVIGEFISFGDECGESGGKKTTDEETTKCPAPHGPDETKHN